MDCPDWVTAADWPRLARALAEHPSAAVDDALCDLRAATAAWDAPARSRLLECFAVRAEAGAGLPAAFVLAICDLLGAPHE